MTNLLKHILFFSFFFTFWLNAQQLRFTQLRLGLDPIFSSTMLVPKIDTKQFPVDYHNIECSTELIGPYRLSFLGEVGYTRMAVNVLGGTQLFKTEGTYVRVGFNFDVSKPDKFREFDLGWRVGFTLPNEGASIYLKGKYWDSDVLLDIPSRTNTYLWGEMLAEYKFCLAPNHTFFRNVWFGSSIRLKINPRELQERPFKTQYVPGLGFGNFISPGFSFNLIYCIHFFGNDIKKAHRLHDNFDLKEDKDHRHKKIRQHKDGADEIDRD